MFENETCHTYGLRHVTHMNESLSDMTHASCPIGGVVSGTILSDEFVTCSSVSE